MVPHHSDKGPRRLDQFGEQRSESGEEGMEESSMEDSINDNNGTEEAPSEEETGNESMDQGYEGDSNRKSNEESDSTDTTLDVSCSPASSQGSARSLHHYSSGCHAGSGSWADQCLCEDGGDLASMDEENASCGTTDENDGGREKPAIPLAYLQGKQEPTEESRERVEEQKGPSEANPAMGILLPAMAHEAGPMGQMDNSGQ